MNRFAVLLCVLSFSLSVAHAAEEIAGAPGAEFEFALPSEMGPVSIDEARRAIRADIEDWYDDYRGLKNKKIFVCAMSGIAAGTIGELAGVGGARAALKLLRRATRLDGPGAPLNLPLSEVMKKVPLTQAERDALERLMRRETPDLSDKIRLAIDFQSLLMKVSVRLYDEAIQAQLAKSGGWRELLRPGQAKCEALRLQMERDQELIRAARGVLGLFDFLELELRD